MDRIPKERYLDPDFFALEAEHLWPRVWQMACRLEEIPRPRDVVEYRILDQSVIVVRTDDARGGGVREHLSTPWRAPGGRTRHVRERVHLPVPRLVLRTGRREHPHPAARTFSEHNLVPGDTDLVPVRCESWGGCAWINLDPTAPPLRKCLEPFATIMDAWKLESMRAEWWSSFRLPVNWKLAEEAFMEQYHVLETHPQLRIPGRFPPRNGAFDPRGLPEAELHYLRTMSEGMAGMVHADDVRVAEGLRDLELPADPALARATWDRTLNDAVVEWHRGWARHPRSERARGRRA